MKITKNYNQKGRKIFCCQESWFTIIDGFVERTLRYIILQIM